MSTKELELIFNKVYHFSNLTISNFKLEQESKEYSACKFKLGANTIICRNAKITPKKVGQFVTFWKRIENGPISPFEEQDAFDYFIINVCKGDLLGQFVIPKEVLVKKGIISTQKKEGKRGFRVYPPWDKVTSKQATMTQKWQLLYFHEAKNQPDLHKILIQNNEL
ncbi:MepB family protein [Zobellia amurskyensis]|uniref:MepB family protein n=1 Tax=Zobellia amurskyensis TaxID=248905 RepID=A0A7X3D1C3_9FLAO|nr:MepB family protein [Zobellia amurskyensis]MUH35480.1 MepB family protein [Zobellia amurskyensis]